MKFSPDILFPPGIIHEDKSVVYKRQLRQNIERQEMRDMMTMALLDNMAHGKEYQSVFETQPELLDNLDEKTRESVLKQLKEMKRHRWDANRGDLA